MKMTALSRDTSRTYEMGNLHVRPVAAGVVIFQGAAVGLNADCYARPLVAGDKFAGFADNRSDNTGGTDGSAEVETRARDRIVLPVPGFTAADVFKPVYASDDNTFTLTADGNSAVGMAVRMDSPGFAVVEFDVARPL
jgi:hypothetical protein